MRVNRFFFPHQGRETLEIRTPDLVQQIGRVLRMEPQEPIALFEGDGLEWSGIITEIKKDSVHLKRSSLEKNLREPQRRVSLCLSILKRENFEWAVEKATEVGVCRIIPLLTERTVKLNLNMERLRKIAREAAEQSGRAMVPEIFEPVRLTEAFKMEGEKVFFDIGPRTNGIKAEQLAIFVGPEGGWSEKEREGAREAGLAVAGLGPTVLRAETAAVVGAFAAMQ